MHRLKNFFEYSVKNFCQTFFFNFLTSLKTIIKKYFQLFYFPVKKIKSKLLVAFLALILIIKLIKVKFMFIIPFLFGVGVAKKLFLKLLLFFVPAFAHVFKLCSSYYSTYATKYHHHHHQVKQKKKKKIFSKHSNAKSLKHKNKRRTKEEITILRCIHIVSAKDKQKHSSRYIATQENTQLK